MPVDTESPVSPTTTSRLRRRWFQMSLRMLLVVVTVVAVGPGSWVTYEQGKLRRERAAVAKLMEAMGTEVYAKPHWLWTLMEGRESGPVVGLGIRQRTITDLTPVSDLTRLVWLHVNDTQVTDASLAPLARLTRLHQLRLDDTRITDDGLATLAGLTELDTLNLSGTQVSDAGLIHLVGLRKLETLYVQKTQVTEAGVKKLQLTLPKLDIAR